VVVDANVGGTAAMPHHHWFTIWMVPAVGALGVLLIFAALFKPAPVVVTPIAAEPFVVV
jgi:hypothetical protein